MNRDGILLVSGGLDSTTLAYWLMKKKINFIPLFINYGQHCAETEYQTLKNVLPQSKIKEIEVVDISPVFKKSNSKFIKEADLWNDSIDANDLYIPYRNILLLTVAASYAQTINLNNVYSAFINSNHAKEIDCSKIFFKRMSGILGDFGSVKIIMPFLNLSKFEVAKIGIKLKAPISSTFSCQASSKIPCGACPNCVDRINALRELEKEFNL